MKYKGLPNDADILFRLPIVDKVISYGPHLMKEGLQHFTRMPHLLLQGEFFLTSR
jgi:hypothetical protein